MQSADEALRALAARKAGLDAKLQEVARLQAAAPQLHQRPGEWAPYRRACGTALTKLSPAGLTRVCNASLLSPTSVSGSSRLAGVHVLSAVDASRQRYAAPSFHWGLDSLRNGPDLLYHSGFGRAALARNTDWCSPHSRLPSSNPVTPYPLTLQGIGTRSATAVGRAVAVARAAGSRHFHSIC
jgi:hypothetical protein